MPFLLWKDQYSVKVDFFDEQHKQLFSLINNLLSSVEDDRNSSGYQEAVNGLIEYTREHFASEEFSMKKYSYPEYDDHRKEHEMLTQEVLNYKKNFSSGISDENDLIRFLMNWLVKHIMGTDKKYSSFFQDKNIKED